MLPELLRNMHKNEAWSDACDTALSIVSIVWLIGMEANEQN